MTCVAPPELDSLALLSALDNEATSGTIAHLEKCEYCRRRRDQLRREHTSLVARLYRIDCPSVEVLDEFHRESLSDDEAARIALHLEDCPHCQQELEWMRRFAEQDPEVPDQRRIQITIGKPDPGPSDELAPVHAVRHSRVGRPETEPLLFKAGDSRISLLWQASADIPSGFDIYGLVTPAGSGEGSASLHHGGDLIVQVPIDSGGNFIFRSLDPDKYELLISLEEVEIVLGPFRVSR